MQPFTTGLCNLYGKVHCARLQGSFGPLQVSLDIHFDWTARFLQALNPSQLPQCCLCLAACSFSMGRPTRPACMALIRYMHCTDAQHLTCMHCAHVESLLSKLMSAKRYTQGGILGLSMGFVIICQKAMLQPLAGKCKTESCASVVTEAERCVLA